jgi:hypothetical protein
MQNMHDALLNQSLQIDETVQKKCTSEIYQDDGQGWFSASTIISYSLASLQNETLMSSNSLPKWF